MGRIHAVVLTLFVGALAGCGILGPDTEHFVIEVTSVTAPETVAPDRAFTVRFQGGIGPDLCSYLDRVERVRASASLTIRFHGARDEGGGDCPAQPSSLDHEERVDPPFDDSFTVRALQPDGTALEEVVRVE